MAIDASIPLGVQPMEVQSPVNAFAKMQQLQGMQQQNAINALALQERQRAIADESNLNRIYGQAYDEQGRLDRNKLFSGMAGANLGSRIPAAQKLLSEQDKAQLETRKIELDNTGKLVGGIASLMYGVKDQSSYDAARNAVAQQYGAEAANRLPLMFNPNDIQRRVNQAMTINEQILRQQKEIDQRLNQEKFDWQKSFDSDKFNWQKFNDTANRNVTIRGQNLTDDRARQNIEIARENAAQGKAPTEDERKAAGWYIQAVDAYNNMSRAVNQKKDVLSPGLFESMASGLGMEGTANVLRSSPRQQFYTAASALSEAALRAATGAGYNMTEYRQKINQFTPTLTDSDKTLQQKMRSARSFIESLRPRAGRALRDVTVPDLQPMPGVDDMSGLPTNSSGSFADNPFSGHPKAIQDILRKY